MSRSSRRTLAAAPVDVSGYVVTDDAPEKADHRFVAPAGTVIAPDGYYVADVGTVAPVFGLGSADSAQLFAADGTTLLDASSWTQHAATTYGRCPDGSGPFTTTATPTRGAADDCPTEPPATPPTPPTPVRPPADPWPGGAEVTIADVAGQLGGNVSGLAYEAGRDGAPDVLWAVENGPSTLYRLLRDGSTWQPDTADGWGAGKALRYPAGTGDPDAEGVTLVAGSSASRVHVSTERDSTVEDTSRPEVLRFDVTGAATTLSATTEFDLTADLPVVEPNKGLEAITWVPDAALVAKGLRDEGTGKAYDPRTHPGHGDGLFVVGLEADGSVRAYALDVDADGAFAVTATYERPAGLPDVNDEGFAIAPQSSRVDGRKPVFWSDDSATDGHALRAGTLRCTVPTTPVVDTSAPTDLVTTLDAPRRVARGAGWTATVRVRNAGTTPAGATTVTLVSLGAGTVTAAPDGRATGALVVFTAPGIAAGQTLVRTVSLRAPGRPSLGITQVFAASVTPDPHPLDDVTLEVTRTR